MRTVRGISMAAHRLYRRSIFPQTSPSSLHLHSLSPISPTPIQVSVLFSRKVTSTFHSRLPPLIPLPARFDPSFPMSTGPSSYATVSGDDSRSGTGDMPVASASVGYVVASLELALWTQKKDSVYSYTPRYYNQREAQLIEERDQWASMMEDERMSA